MFRLVTLIATVAVSMLNNIVGIVLMCSTASSSRVGQRLAAASPVSTPQASLD